MAPRRSKQPPKAAAPQFDAEPLHDDDEEHACPIPDEDGNVVLRREKPPRRKPRGTGEKQPRKR